MLHRNLPNRWVLTFSSHSGLEPLPHRKTVLNRLAEPHFLFAGVRENGSISH